MSVTARTGTHTVVPPWRDWRSWQRRVQYAWRRSLRFRTLSVTLTLTALTILVALVWMSLAILTDLYESRAEQVQDAAQVLGITLHDHLIIGKSRELSFRSAGYL